MVLVVFGNRQNVKDVAKLLFVTFVTNVMVFLQQVIICCNGWNDCDGCDGIFVDKK